MYKLEPPLEKVFSSNLRLKIEILPSAFFKKFGRRSLQQKEGGAHYDSVGQFVNGVT